MIVRDMIGNEIKPKQMLFWKEKNLLVNVDAIEPPKGNQPGFVAISMPLPFEGKAEQISFPDFVVVRHPMEELMAQQALENALCENALEGKGKVHADGIHSVKSNGDEGR